MTESPPEIEVKGLDMAYGSYIVMKDLNFTIRKGEVFIIMGGSGCGKSTLLKHLIGLKKPVRGEIWMQGQDFVNVNEAQKLAFIRKFGVMYQGGALWSSMTLGENVSLPLEEFTNLSRSEIRDIVSFKLSLVGLSGFEDFYPAEISGGMRKRASLARAMALDPEILFFDEPSAGLDPISSRRLDDLILQLRDSLGTTIVVVTHELASLFAIGTRAIFLDPKSKTMIAEGAPNDLLEHCKDPQVHAFLTRSSA
jgi:phospholipid/cholesterol/gamma-HCH transport system ATP-binding protein